MHFAIKRKARWKQCATYLVVAVVPIANKKSELSERCGIWNWDDYSLRDVQSSETSGCSVKCGRREVHEGPDLILQLELVCPVRAWRDWALCPEHSILPWVLPLLDPVPDCQQQADITSIIIIVFNWLWRYKWNVEIYFLRHHVRRKGSSRLLMRFRTMLSLVTPSMGGPGNWLLIKMPCKNHSN